MPTGASSARDRAGMQEKDGWTTHERNKTPLPYPSIRPSGNFRIGDGYGRTMTLFTAVEWWLVINELALMWVLW
jgi:hypothetical protein